MCFYLYIHNKYTQYTHILCKQKLLFWMRLFAINHLTALIYIQYIYIYIYIYIKKYMLFWIKASAKWRFIRYQPLMQSVLFREPINKSKPRRAHPCGAVLSLSRSILSGGIDSRENILWLLLTPSSETVSALPPQTSVWLSVAERLHYKQGWKTVACVWNSTEAIYNI